MNRIYRSVVFIGIVIRHELGLDRPVSASSNSSSTGLLSRLRQFGLQWSIILAFYCYFLLHVVVNPICVFLLLVNWFYFQLFKMFYILFVVKMCALRRPSEKFHLDWCQSFFILLSEVQIFLLSRRMGIVYHWRFLYRNWFKVLFTIPKVWENFASFLNIISYFHMKFHNRYIQNYSLAVNKRVIT